MSGDLDDLDFDNIGLEEDATVTPPETVVASTDELKTALRVHFEAAEDTFNQIGECQHDQARIQNIANTMKSILQGYAVIAAMLDKKN